MTALYLRAASNRTTSLGNGHTSKRYGSASTWAVPDSLDTSAGTSVFSRTEATVAGPTDGLEFTPGGLPTLKQFLSPPLAEAVTISGTVTLRISGYESSMSANAKFGVYIQKVSAVDHSFTMISDSVDDAEMSTSKAINSWTTTPTSTALAKGDRIRVVVYYDDAGTMASGYSVVYYYNGSAANSEDSSVEFTETLSFMSPNTVQQLFAADVASDISTSDIDKRLWVTPGISYQTLTVNTVTGYTSPVQWTDSAGGTPVTFWTPPLQAATLSGVIEVDAWAHQSNALALACIYCQVAVTDGDGSNPTVYGIGRCSNPVALTVSPASARMAFQIAGSDLSISDGQRLRVRFGIDDAEVAGTGMVSGYTATLYYNYSASELGGTLLGLPVTLALLNPPTQAPRPPTELALHYLLR